jgi:hypothetical protein
LRRLLTALALLSAVALVAHAQTPRRNVRASNTGIASIRGRVVADDETGAPIRNARVSLTSQAGTIPTVLADSEGRFAITSLPAGRYSLSATKPGYVKTIFGARRTGDPAMDIALADRAQVDGIEIRIPRSGAISGRVVDDVGDPVAGITVTTELVTTAPQSGTAPGKTVAAGSAQTNDLGEYRISGLAEGSFLVSLGGRVALTLAEGSSAVISVGAAFSSRTYYPGLTSLSEAQPISVSRGEERSVIDFVIAVSRLQSTFNRSADAARALTSADSGALRGQILRGDGRPLARARIRLSLGGTTRTTESEDDGSYEFQRLAPGDYIVSASKSGFVDATFGQGGPLLRTVTVKVDPGKTREHIDITLPSYGAIEGRLTDEHGDPMEGVLVRALQLRFAAGRQRLVVVPQITAGLTDDRGRYRLSGVGPGQYFVSSLVGQVIANAADVPGYAPTFFPGTGNPAEARAVTVGLSQVLSDVDFAVTSAPTARVSGIALKSNGEPVQGNLTMKPSERSRAALSIAVGARIDPDGSFEFPNVAPGEYVIRASKDRPNTWTEGELASLFVTVTGTDVPGLVLQMSPGSTISGHIRLDGASSITSRSIELAALPIDPDQSAPQMARADVRDDWTFEIGGINGPRRLRLLDAPRGWALKAIYLNGVDITDRPLPFGTASQSLGGLDVVLTDQTPEISGNATDETGRPLPSSSVIAFSVDRDLWYQDSRFIRRGAPWVRGGRFVITGLPPGEYFIAAVARLASEDDRQDPEFLDSIVRQATRILLAEGQKVSVDLKLISR